MPAQRSSQSICRTPVQAVLGAVSQYVTRLIHERQGPENLLRVGGCAGPAALPQEFPVGGHAVKSDQKLLETPVIAGFCAELLRSVADDKRKRRIVLQDASLNQINKSHQQNEDPADELNSNWFVSVHLLSTAFGRRVLCAGSFGRFVTHFSPETKAIQARVMLKDKRIPVGGGADYSPAKHFSPTAGSPLPQHPHPSHRHPETFRGCSIP